MTVLMKNPIFVPVKLSLLFTETMLDLNLMRQKFAELQCCIIIPTYNHDHALEDVINGVLQYTLDVIVVNDGSTDKTPFILEQFPQIQSLHIPLNTGKGWALRQGFIHAIEKGYRYAITIDSDGQHFPDDLPLFLDLIEKQPDSMILGARDMTREEVPGTSSFGHKFSIFWFKIETGITVLDVQTGYRLYPLHKIKEIRWVMSKKYEYEVEILVRLAWRGVNVLSVPVRIYYAPKDIRISHFRKFRDFTRVSIANSLLVFMAILWVRPLSFFKGLRKKSIRDFIQEYIVNSQDSNLKIAFSVALGLFIGVIPIWGWQMLATFGLAHLFKLNKFVAVASSNISLPPMLPLIIFLSYMIGGWVMGANISNLDYSQGFGIQWIKENLIQYLLGSLILGLMFALFLGPVTYLLLSFFRKKNV
jgi:glycosyltransferase involved in cell wall biosynthesis